MDHFEISLHLFVRRKRMDGAELGPCHRDHLARRVELHRARTEWDHRAIEREILVGQAAQIAQHLVLAVVAMKHRMREDLVDSVWSAFGVTASIVDLDETAVSGLPPTL